MLYKEYRTSDKKEQRVDNYKLTLLEAVVEAHGTEAEL